MDGARIAECLDGHALRFASGHSHFVPFAGCADHATNAIEIVCHWSGAGTTRFGDGSCTSFAQQSIEIYPPHLIHRQSMTVEGDDVFLIAIPAPSIIEAFTSRIFIPRLDDAFARGEFLALSRAERDAPPLRRAEHDHRVAALFLHLLGLSEGGSGPAPATIEERHARNALTLIHERFATIAGVDEIARDLGISASRLRHAFSRVHGRSVVRALMEARIEHGRRLLAETELPVERVAANCGFRDPAYFARLFRRFDGRSPSETRSAAGRSRP